MIDNALFQRILTQLERLADAAESLRAQDAPAPQWDRAIAFRWRKRAGHAWLEPVPHPATLRLDDLHHLQRQKDALARNTRQFVNGLPANNALLWGARGTGKSSLIKALLSAYHDQGLRLIEVDRTDLVDLPEITAPLFERPERFLIFCDDLSFEANDPSYKALKVALDGSINAAGDNVLIYATSNRRHLMPESMAENLEARHVQGELHPGEATEEKISLSERFGLWLSFHPFNQDQYLDITAHWLRAHGIEPEPGEESPWRKQALRWALARGSRSGRIAYQFARDWAGRERLGD